MSSTVLDPVAVALETKITALGITAYKWSRRDIAPPCGVVELPTTRRTDLDVREDHMGQNDWWVEYPVAFYRELDEPATAQAALVETIEAFILAIDADQDLTNGGSPVVQEAKVVEATPFAEPLQQTRVLIGYETRVAVLKFVPSQ